MVLMQCYIHLRTICGLKLAIPAIPVTDKPMDIF